MEQELLTIPDYLSASPNFREVHVARSLMFCVTFSDLIFWNCFKGVELFYNEIVHNSYIIAIRLRMCVKKIQ